MGGTSGAGGSGPDSTAGVRAVPGTQEDLVQAAGDRIFFDTDRNALNAQATATLDRQAAWLQQYSQVNVWIAGNCDERGTEEYNLALGQRRANADRDYLVAHGINGSRIQTISYGKSRPIDAASTPEAWAQNRNAITSIR
jgi:peptidoglycan-associated lipoprotein